MYREDPKLMEQYLGCLLAVYNSARKYRSIETHVVFDDAFAAKRTLNEHARVFVALCKDMLKESDANVARTIDMPYGSQIVITLEDGMLVYLHFKDTEKVTLQSPNACHQQDILYIMFTDQ